MKNTIYRSFKIWISTALLGSLFFLLVFPETGSMGFDEFLFICGISAAFSSPAIFISWAAIQKLKNLPEERWMRLLFVTGATLVSIAVVLVLFTRYEAVSITGLLYPYCITALVMTFYFTRDLIFVHYEETPVPHHRNTEL